MIANTPARLAALWAGLFALPSFYWALGGDSALETIAADPEQALGAGAEPMALLASGCLKLLGALFALSYARVSLPVSRRLRVIAGVAATGALAVYGLLGLLDHILMLTGARDVPEALGSRAVRWHLVLWDPVWLAGAGLFALALQRYRHATPHLAAKPRP